MTKHIAMKQNQLYLLRSQLDETIERATSQCILTGKQTHRSGGLHSRFEQSPLVLRKVIVSIAENRMQFVKMCDRSYHIP